MTVRVKPEAPATLEFGLRLPIVGAAVALIVNVAGPDTPPVVVVTVTLGVPGAAIIAAVTGAVQWPASTYVVARAVEFQVIRQVASKELPSAVSVKPDAPAVAEAGDSDVIDGEEEPALVNAKTPFAVAVTEEPAPDALIVAVPSVLVSTLYVVEGVMPASVCVAFEALYVKL